MGTEQGVTPVPAKYRQGDDLLCMLARTYKSNLFMAKWGNFERQSRLPGPTVVCPKENGVRKTYPGYSFI